MRMRTIVLFCALAGCSDRNLGPAGGGDGGGSDGGGTHDGATPADLAGATVCGGLAFKMCPTGQYCEFGASCGAGDQQGVCTPIPSACGKNIQQVCGCDGVTYGNPCLAQQAGVSVAHDGPCQTPGTSCGGFAGLQCQATEWCDYPDNMCGGNDGSGTCQPRPGVCSALYDPVCGCDGKTYSNECEANGAGVDISQKGMCGQPADCRTTGCPSSQKCQLCWTSYQCLPPNVAC